jgi:uncharacterized protein DUF6196
LVSISKERSEQTNARLLDVVAKSRLVVLPGAYAFVDCPANPASGNFPQDALALVRDGKMWSQLVSSDDVNAELFRVFSFHFPANIDNSGFVGWLAARLKTQFGTGVFVVCGHNSADGGIFDYWGVPLAVGGEVIEAVRALVGGDGGALN